MEHIAYPETRPWERPFWRPAPGKAGVLLYLVLIHLLAAIGLVLFPLPGWKILGWTLVFTALGGLGTTIDYHRMLAHRALKVNRAIEHLPIFWAMFNGSGAPASWVAYHRLHHSRADTPEDICSPRQGGVLVGAPALAVPVCQGGSQEVEPGVDSQALHDMDPGGSSCDPAVPVLWLRARMAGLFLDGRNSPGLFAAHAVFCEQHRPPGSL